MNEKLEELKVVCRNYLNNNNLINDDYLFHICYCDKKCYMIIFQKCKDTKDNEKRIKDMIDPLYALFRADVLNIVRIIDLETMNDDLDHVVSTTITWDDNNKIPKARYIETFYIKDQPFRSDRYDDNIENVHSDGIYYYKSLDVAFYNYAIDLNNYTGYYVSYFPNGTREGEGLKENGIDHGQWMYYDHDKKLAEIGLVADDKKQGRWQVYCFDPKTYKLDRFIIMDEIDYVDGIRMNDNSSENAHTE